MQFNSLFLVDNELLEKYLINTCTSQTYTLFKITGKAACIYCSHLWDSVADKFKTEGI
jgi:hypothetical protein